MFFKKRRKKKMEYFLENALSVPDTYIIVVKPKDCSLLFQNSYARRKMGKAMPSKNFCKESYAQLFPGICRKCPCLKHNMNADNYSFEIEDEGGRLFKATCNSIKWIDNQNAVIIFMQDIEQKRLTEKKLYSLAYTDQLTGAPNRRKLREDFEAYSDDLRNDRVSGVMALFDLDDFKSINDTYGHNTGDIMLKRLTEHLQEDETYRGHLYRLGGDEFVLLYFNKELRFSKESEYIAHFEGLLKGALMNYTLPNIDLNCTISMGAAFFPYHGATSSELLRKADIALYKAKDLGKNQLFFFQDIYDTAKKLKNLYINIQPVLESKGKTFGYELVDCGSDDKEEEGSVNLKEFNRAIDALGLEELESNTKYFISYSNQLLNRAVLKNLPRDKFIIQIQIPSTIGKRTLLLYKTLRANGYSLAINGLCSSNYSPELIGLADYCKFDTGNISEAMQMKIMMEHPTKKFIASNVNTSFEYDTAKRLGFKLFQGFYFKQPSVTKKTKEIAPLKVNYYKLLKLTSTEDYVNFKEISEIISSDVALSYKLLKLLNSAAVGLGDRISSINMAVTYLGEERLKRWIALLSLRGITSDKPLEIMRMSLIRAQFAELLAPYFTPRRNSKHLFFVGMLSLLHIALDKSMAELLDEMPVADEVRESLLSKNGIYSDMLPFFSNYEYSNWEEINRFAENHGLDSQMISNCYISSVKWYNDLIGNKAGKERYNRAFNIL